MAPLRDWIDANKPRVHVSEKIDPVGSSDDVYGDSDRSIYALDAIAASQELITLQDGAFLNGSTWLTHLTQTSSIPSDQVAALENAIQTMQLTPTVQLVMALLYEHGLDEKSRFFGYIAQLPKRIPLPMTWDAKARRTLKHTAASPSIDDELVASMFTSFAAPLARKFPSIWSEKAQAFEHFQWAYTVVSSRAFTIADAKEPTLLPVIDMANHDHGNPSAKIVKNDNGSFQLVALREIAKGDAVTISYGDLSNAELLCRYGFVLPESVPSDCILVQSAELLHTYAAFINDDADTNSTNSESDHDDDDGDNDSKQSATKRRKLFAAPAKSGKTTAETDSLFFLLHGDQEKEFGLSDTLLSFVFAKNLPAEVLYDVLAVLLRKRDKKYSDALETVGESTSSHRTDEQQALVNLLNKHERDVCRRILIGILTLEEGSSDEELSEDEEDEHEELEESDDNEA